MDLLLDALDRNFLNDLYPADLPPDNTVRQVVTLLGFAFIGGYILYFSVAILSYVFLFDKSLEKHPKFLPNQIRREITVACTSIPIMAVLTTPIFMLELKGYSKLYYGFNNGMVYDSLYVLLSIFLCIMWADCGLYWIHRWLHHPRLYKYIHKLHHTWLIPTPFASFAFHPVDGVLQSLPYHSFMFIWPFEKRVYLVFFILLQLWTFNIHDHNYKVPDCLKSIVNGSAHHTDHHLYFYCNLGQLFTFWDKVGGTWKAPSVYNGEGPFVDLIRIREMESKGKSDGKNGSKGSKKGLNIDNKRNTKQKEN